MIRVFLLPLAVLLAALLAAPAGAVSPGPSARQQLLGLGVCEDGPFEGQPCVDASDCHDGSGGPVRDEVCTTQTADVVVRGILTLIADKDAGTFTDTTTIPLTEDAAGNVVPVDFSKTTLTVVLEFTKDGKDFGFAETFQDLGDYVNPDLSIDCRGFCVPTWREPAVESRIANPDESDDSGSGGGGGGGGGGGTGGGGGGTAGGEGIRIQWATPSPAMAAAIREALGLSSEAVPFLETVSTTRIFDHSAADDPLASLRRMKVLIRVLLPEASP